MIINATPTVYPEFYERIASAVGSLQLIANIVYLLDSAGNEIAGSRISVGQGGTAGGVDFSSVGEVLHVKYVNSIVGISPVALRLVFLDVTTLTEHLLVHFEFDAPVIVPAWGYWSIDFSVLFSECACPTPTP